jgi:hypothetical protein
MISCLKIFRLIPSTKYLLLYEMMPTGSRNKDVDISSNGRRLSLGKGKLSEPPERDEWSRDVQPRHLPAWVGITHVAQFSRVRKQ